MAGTKVLKEAIKAYRKGNELTPRQKKALIDYQLRNGPICLLRESETPQTLAARFLTNPTEPEPVMELVFNKAERMADGDKRVFVYSKETGSTLGYIWKIGDRNWETDYNLNVSLALPYSVEDPNLPNLKKRLQGRIANK